jgi:hypothetical protein
MLKIMMHRIVRIKSLLVFIILFSTGLYALDQFDMYRHPSLPIEFKAPAGWQQITHSEDELIFEVMSTDSVIHVILWYTETEQSASDYLWKMANMKDLVLDNKPVEIEIGKHSGWILRVPGYKNKIPIRAMLVVISYGKSENRPKENKLYIAEIWCPEKQFSHQQKIMEDILKSININ